MNPVSGFWSVTTLETVGSTNDEATALAEAGAREGTVIRALRQEAGRGRRGRGWTSPPGNVYSSAILRPRTRPDLAAQLSFVAALAVADVAVAVLPPGAPVTLKGPNDVLVDGAKISGILLESILGADGNVAHVIVGTGINVASAPPAAATGYGATCLAEQGVTVSAEEVFVAYLDALERWYGVWTRGGFAPVGAAWTARAAWIGREITVRLGEDALTGRNEGVDNAGALLLRLPDGSVRRITAGEVFPPREGNTR